MGGQRDVLLGECCHEVRLLSGVGTDVEAVQCSKLAGWLARARATSEPTPVEVEGGSDEDQKLRQRRDDDDSSQRPGAEVEAGRVRYLFGRKAGLVSLAKGNAL
jgi:hypothetical protein